jgi:hypothetical protein
MPGMRRLLTLLLLLAGAADSRANGPPPPPQRREHFGHPVGEPAGLAGVIVERARLTIDLRPLAREAVAVVEAEYHFRHDGPPRPLELLFIAGRPLGEADGVWLDGQPLSVRPAPEAQWPSGWEPPGATPWRPGAYAPRYFLHGRDPEETVGQSWNWAPIPRLPYRPPSEVLFACSVPLTAGAHELRLHYSTVPAAHMPDDSPRRLWQLAYMFGPARDWGRACPVEVTVELPPGWQAAVTPQLQRDGDTLTGSIAVSSANALALTLQAPTHTLHVVMWVSGICAALAVLSGLVVVTWRVGRCVSTWEGRRNGSFLTPGLLCPCAAVCWALAGWVFLRVLFPALDWLPSLSKQASTHYPAAGQAYSSDVIGIMLWMFALGPLLFMVGMIVFLVASRTGYHRGLRAPPPAT